METIEKGQIYKCIKDYVMHSGAIDYKCGVIYTSQKNGCLTDEEGFQSHKMTINKIFKKHFELITNDINPFNLLELLKIEREKAKQKLQLINDLIKEYEL